MKEKTWLPVSVNLLKLSCSLMYACVYIYKKNLTQFFIYMEIRFVTVPQLDGFYNSPPFELPIIHTTAKFVSQHREHQLH